MNTKQMINIYNNPINNSYEQLIELIEFLNPITKYSFKVGQQISIQNISKRNLRVRAEVYKVEDGFAYVVVDYDFVCNASKLVALPYSNIIISEVELLGYDIENDVAILKIKSKEVIANKWYIFTTLYSVYTWWYRWKHYNL